MDAGTELATMAGDLPDIERAIRTDGLSITRNRRNYVIEHLRRCGWRADDLNDERLLTVFSLIARLEEYETTKRHNGHNWELIFAPLSRRRLGSVPILEVLTSNWEREGVLQRCAPEASRWPDGKPFCLCLTHDVDQLQEYLWQERLRSMWHHSGAPGWAKAVLVGSIGKGMVRRATTARRQNTPPLDAWLEVEDRFGFKSTFHFFADPLARPTWEDVFYRHSDIIDFEGRRNSIGDVINIVASRGWDVGLHGSCSAHVEPELLRAERESLERVAHVEVTSTRQHHLMCDVRKTPKAHADANLRIDSTFGSNINIEFRCGTCLPFQLFDLEADQPLSVIEVPLTIQDLPLGDQSAGDGELMYRRCIELMDRVAEHRGVLTLLWHNQHRPTSVEFRCYERVLAEASARGAWGCSMKQLDQWWRKDG